jgi:hypothetical protein
MILAFHIKKMGGARTYFQIGQIVTKNPEQISDDF